MMNRISIAVIAAVFLTMGGGVANMTFAHCDAMDGPVVRAAQDALETRNVELALIWVQKEDETEIRLCGIID